MCDGRARCCASGAVQMLPKPPVSEEPQSPGQVARWRTTPYDSHTPPLPHPELCLKSCAVMCVCVCVYVRGCVCARARAVAANTHPAAAAHLHAHTHTHTPHTLNTGTIPQACGGHTARHLEPDR